MFRLIILPIVSFALASCGAALPNPPSDAAGSSDAQLDVKDATLPPAQYYDQAFSLKLDEVFGGRQSSGEEPVVRLVFDGGSLKRGFKAKQSFLLCEEESLIPPSQLSESDRNKVLYYVQEYFKPKNIKVDTRSTQGHVVYVGGSPASIGCDGAPIKFRAPIDSGNLVSNDIAFVFEGVGLDELVTHIETAIETMTLAEAELALAEDTVAGAKEINSMSRLLWELDRSKVLDISPIMPDLNALIPGGARYLDGFDKIITVTMGVGSKGQPSTPATSGLQSWIGGLVNGASGSADMISAVAVLSGHPEIAMATQVLGPVLLGGTTGTKPPASKPNEKRLPDYAGLISVKNQADLIQLFGSMNVHHQYLYQNYDGETAKILDSMLVVAFAQSYRTYAESEIAPKESPKE